MKKRFLILALLVLIALALPLLANADTSGTCGENLSWTLTNSGVLTISGTGDITECAFYNNSDVKTVKIQNGVNGIGNYAFYDCSNLTSVTIPNSVTNIGMYAFWGCSSLTSVTIPGNVVSIGQSAFGKCSSLTSVTIPNSITSIVHGTFWGCSSLTGVTIPNSVTSIGEVAFEGCSSLTSVTIPNSVTSIGAYAFRGCTSLTSVTIPNSVTEIGYRAFYGCSSLTDVYYTGTEAQWNTITIGSDNNCLTDATIHFNYGAGPTIIASGTWGNLTWTLDNNGLLIISGTGAMKDLYESVKAPWGVYVINQVEIQQGVTSIGNYAFFEYSSLTSVTIPNSVTSIGEGAFAFCKMLKKIDLASGNNSFCSVNGVIMNKAKTKIITCPAGKTGTYVIPSSVSIIGVYAFAGCSSLTSVTIPNSVTSIDAYAFRGCTSLTSMTIPNSVTSIGYLAFSDCSSLTSVTIPNSVTSIDKGAFICCSSDLTISCYSGSTAYDYAIANNIKVLLLDTKPVITTQPTNKTVNEGAKATFKVVATDATGYQWYYRKPDNSTWYAVSNGGTSATYTLTTAARHNGYKYRVKVSNSAGYVYSNIVTLTVNLKPVITTQPSNKKVNEGAKATFKVVATGATGYQWHYQKPNDATWYAVSSNGTSATYSLTTAARHNGYKYKVKVSNNAGYVYSNIVTLTVNLKPVITTQPSNQKVNEGAKATFKVVATGATGYQWHYLKPKDSTWYAVSNNGTSASYILTTSARHNGYKYKVKVSNSVGYVWSNVVTLTVTTAAKPTITTQPANQTVNEGAKATFKVVATNADSYQWHYQKPNDSTWTAVSNNGTSATYTLTTAARHNGYKYKVKVSNSAGYVWSNTVTLTVKSGSKPVITGQPSNVFVVAGMTATFKVTATGAMSYQWYYQKPGETTWNAVTNNGASATYTFTAAVRYNGYKYKCLVTNAVGSVESNVVTLTVK
ncbi:MAG: leucine-rich repeat protein [Clostridia bacterium]|nr:leucine-rich repeat protein [Clostridia bacterium]